MINDDSDEEENDANYYRAFDNITRNDHSEPTSSTASDEIPLTFKQIKTFERLLKKSEICLKSFYKYIKEHTILGFNSQKYDLPLIIPYLPSSLIKLGHKPKQVIKRSKGYMVIATQKFKFLDITNYLAAGTSLAQF